MKIVHSETLTEWCLQYLIHSIQYIVDIYQLFFLQCQNDLDLRAVKLSDVKNSTGIHCANNGLLLFSIAVVGESKPVLPELGIYRQSGDFQGSSGD